MEVYNISIIYYIYIYINIGISHYHLLLVCVYYIILYIHTFSLDVGATEWKHVASHVCVSAHGLEAGFVLKFLFSGFDSTRRQIHRSKTSTPRPPHQWNPCVFHHFQPFFQSSHLSYVSSYLGIKNMFTESQNLRWEKLIPPWSLS